MQGRTKARDERVATMQAEIARLRRVVEDQGRSGVLARRALALVLDWRSVGVQCPPDAWWESSRVTVEVEDAGAVLRVRVSGMPSTSADGESVMRSLPEKPKP